MSDAVDRTVQVRALESRDIEALQLIDRAAHGEAWSTRAFADQIAHPGVRHLVAVRSDQVVGHAGCWHDGDTARITNVAVADQARGQGIASTLLAALLDDLRPNVERVRLEVRPSNRGAQRLYGRFGFAPAGIERGFYDRSDDRGSRDALVMTVDDPHSPAFADRLASLAPQTSRSSP